MAESESGYVMYYYLGPGALSDAPTKDVTLAMWRRLPAHIRKSIANSPLYRREHSPYQGGEVKPAAGQTEDAEAVEAAAEDAEAGQAEDAEETEDAEAAGVKETGGRKKRKRS